MEWTPIPVHPMRFIERPSARTATERTPVAPTVADDEEEDDEAAAADYYQPVFGLRPWIAATRLLARFARRSIDQPAPAWTLAMMWLCIAGVPRLAGYLLMLYVVDPGMAMLFVLYDCVSLWRMRNDRRTLANGSKYQLTLSHALLVWLDVAMFTIPTDNRYGEAIRLTRFAVRAFWIVLDGFNNWLLMTRSR